MRITDRFTHLFFPLFCLRDEGGLAGGGVVAAETPADEGKGDDKGEKTMANKASRGLRTPSLGRARGMKAATTPEGGRVVSGSQLAQLGRGEGRASTGRVMPWMIMVMVMVRDSE